jgi:hypothetical protein
MRPAAAPDQDIERRAVAAGLRAGWDVSDLEFDRIYPEWVRKLSEPHFTPIDVARRAAELLAGDSTTKVLDIGSGAGKFCLVGSLTTQATFIGVEQRRCLVDVAEHTAKLCHTTRARFIHGNMMDLDWTEFDGFYLFNPFYEHVANFLTPMHDPIELSPQLYKRYIVATCVKLFTARIGARVVTYHGFGGPMPPGYRQILREPAGSEYLELWEKEPLSSGVASEREAA